MSRMLRFAALFPLLVPFPASAAVTCADVLKALGQSLADVNCFTSPDLTTTNPSTTPANDSLPGLPGGAFTPITDRSVIAPSAGQAPANHKVVPGLQLNARIASDPQGQARFLLRLPDDWNGRLVVAGASGTRSEFNGDFAWSDYVVQKGYAYASQNKGGAEPAAYLARRPPDGPLACRLNPASPTFVHFYDNDPGQPSPAGPISWSRRRTRPRRREGALRPLAALHLRGGDVERWLPGAPRGGDAPEALRRRRRLGRTFVDEHAPNILTDLPPAILNFPDYASGFDPERAPRRAEHPGRGLSARHRVGARRRCGVFTTRSSGK